MAAEAEKSSNDRVVCYYTNWSVYRQGIANYNPQNINPYLCTHLIYAFGGLTKDFELKPFDNYQDIEKGQCSLPIELKTFPFAYFLFFVFVIYLKSTGSKPRSN
jgi:chitinase